MPVPCIHPLYHVSALPADREKYAEISWAVGRRRFKGLHLTAVACSPNHEVEKESGSSSS